MKIKEKLINHFFLIATIISSLIVVLIFGFMFIFGLPLFKGGHFLKLFTLMWNPYKGMYGILPMVIGTIMISFLGISFAFPFCFGCAAFISELGPKRLSDWMKKVVYLMTCVPTVVYGFVGIFLLVPVVRELFRKGSGMCILSASLMVSILVSPTMILFFIDSFNQVPESYLKAIDALGGNKVQKLIYVIVPYSLKGIVTGFILGLGRALGDTLIALMIAGNAINIPHSILDSARTLTSHIALVFASDYESMEFKSIFACGLILYLFTTLLFLVIRLLVVDKIN